MKSLKVLVCTACLAGAVSGMCMAKEVQTIAGDMSIPDTVSMVSASHSNTRNYIESQLKDVPSLSAYEADRAKAHNNGDAKFRTSSVAMGQMMAKEILNNLGVTYDVYQLQGIDGTGQKDGEIVAIDVKTIAQQLAKSKPDDPMFAAAMAALDQGQIDPITEQLLLNAVNTNLPTTKTIIPLNSPIHVSSKDAKQGMITPKRELTLTVEDTEPMQRLNGAKYQTYTIGSRLLLTDDGIQNPLYGKMALVMKPGKPTVYIAFTSDVQRSYFQPIFDNAFKSIK